MDHLRPQSIEEMKQLNVIPVVIINHDGKFTYINQAFTNAYGWTQEDLDGQLVTAIMPPHTRQAHNLGFSRFLTTEQPKIAGQALPLAVHRKDGTSIDAEHYIIGEKHEGHWVFAATIIVR